MYMLLSALHHKSESIVYGHSPGLVNVTCAVYHHRAPKYCAAAHIFGVSVEVAREQAVQYGRGQFFSGVFRRVFKERSGNISQSFRESTLRQASH